jgi:hypothetical protein
MYKLLYSPDSIAHITKAADWYDKKSIGLGDRFIDEVFAKTEILKTNPYFKELFNDVRGLLIENFPYRIHFKVIESKKNVKNPCSSSYFAKPQNLEKIRLNNF